MMHEYEFYHWDRFKKQRIIEIDLDQYLKK